MRYIVYLFSCLVLLGMWVLGIALPLGKVGIAVVTVATMGSLVALLIYYERDETKSTSEE